MGLPTYFIFQQSYTQAVGALAICTVTALVLNLELIRRIFVKSSWGEIEVQMREKLAEADETIKLMRSLAKPLVSSSIRLLSWRGRAGGGITHEEKKAYFDQLSEIATALKIADEPSINSAKEEFLGFIAHDLLILFQSACTKKGVAEIEKVNSLGTLVTTSRQTHARISKEEIERTLGIKISDLSGDLQALLEDYYYFLDHKTLRRPHVLEQA